MEYSTSLFRLAIAPITLFASYFGADLASLIFAKLYAMNQEMPLENLSEDYFMGFLSAIIFTSTFIILIPVVFIVFNNRFHIFNKSNDEGV